MSAVWSIAGFAQTLAAEAKQFAKDGLSFSCPNGWTLKDESDDDAPYFNIGRADSEGHANPHAGGEIVRT